MMAMLPASRSASYFVQDSLFPKPDADGVVQSTGVPIGLPDETSSQQPAITGSERSSAVTSKEPALGRESLMEPSLGRESFMEPPLKRLHCNVLKTESSTLVRSAAHTILDDVKYSDQHSVSRAAANLDRTMPSMTNEDEPSEISRSGSEAPDQEDEESGCVTPTAREQRIPESKDLVCPPPPRKLKAATIRRASSLPSAHQPLNLLICPPDLHTFSECIRALFDK